MDLRFEVELKDLEIRVVIISIYGNFMESYKMVKVIFIVVFVDDLIVSCLVYIFEFEKIS